MGTPDGNVAFKVNWVYGEHGPFSTPCTAEGRRINIKVRQATWCRQPECPCRKLFDEGADAPYSEASGKPACYDSVIFKRWAFSGGQYHGRHRGGEMIPFKHYKVGKLAFFTTRHYDVPEKDRIVVGAFRMERAVEDPDFGGLMIAPATCGCG